MTPFPACTLDVLLYLWHPTVLTGYFNTLAGGEMSLFTRLTRHMVIPSLTDLGLFSSFSQELCLIFEQCSCSSHSGVFFRIQLLLYSFSNMIFPHNFQITISSLCIVWEILKHMPPCHWITFLQNQSLLLFLFLLFWILLCYYWLLHILSLTLPGPSLANLVWPLQLAYLILQKCYFLKCFESTKQRVHKIYFLFQ